VLGGDEEKDDGGDVVGGEEDDFPHIEEVLLVTMATNSPPRGIGRTVESPPFSLTKYSANYFLHKSEENYDAFYEVNKVVFRKGGVEIPT
jgi:hypothetical protein